MPLVDQLVLVDSYERYKKLFNSTTHKPVYDSFSK